MAVTNDNLTSGQAMPDTHPGHRRCWKDFNNRTVCLTQTGWQRHIIVRRSTDPEGRFNTWKALEILVEDMETAVTEPVLCHKSAHKSDDPELDKLKWDYYTCSTNEDFAGDLVHVAVARLDDGAIILTAFYRPSVRREARRPTTRYERDRRNPPLDPEPCRHADQTLSVDSPATVQKHPSLDAAVAYWREVNERRDTGQSPGTDGVTSVNDAT